MTAYFARLLSISAFVGFMLSGQSALADARSTVHDLALHRDSIYRAIIVVVPPETLVDPGLSPGSLDAFPGRLQIQERDKRRLQRLIDALSATRFVAASPSQDYRFAIHFFDAQEREVASVYTDQWARATLIDGDAVSGNDRLLAVLETYVPSPRHQ